MAWFGIPSIAGIALSGDKQLKRKLQRLHQAAETKLARHALLQAGRPMVKAIKQNIGTMRMSRKREAEFTARGLPGSFTGNLRRSIGQAVRQYKRTGVVLLVIGPRWPMGAHGHLVEYGTQPRFTKAGAFRGKMPAMPFMRSAWDANIGSSKAILQNTMRVGVLREATKP